MIHCLGGDIQARGDLGVGQVFRQQGEDVHLAGGEAEGVVACGGPRPARDVLPAGGAHALPQVGGGWRRAEPIKDGERRRLCGLVTIGEGAGVLVRATEPLPFHRRGTPIARQV